MGVTQSRRRDARSPDGSGCSMPAWRSGRPAAPQRRQRQADAVPLSTAGHLPQQLRPSPPVLTETPRPRCDTAGRAARQADPDKPSRRAPAGPPTATSGESRARGAIVRALIDLVYICRPYKKRTEISGHAQRVGNGSERGKDNLRPKIAGREMHRPTGPGDMVGISWRVPL